MITISYRDSRPIYEQIRRGFSRLITTGVLKPDTRLPSIGETAAGLTVNPDTVARAYELLEEDGLICTVPGKGSYVCDMTERVMAEQRRLLTQQLGDCVRQLKLNGISRDEVLRLSADAFDADTATEAENGQG